jgi:hypothetical protein
MIRKSSNLNFDCAHAFHPVGSKFVKVAPQNYAMYAEFKEWVVMAIKFQVIVSTALGSKFTP